MPVIISLVQVGAYKPTRDLLDSSRLLSQFLYVAL